MFHLINHDPNSLIYLWPDWLVDAFAVFAVGLLFVTVIAGFFAGAVALFSHLDEVMDWLDHVWHAVTFKAARDRRRELQRKARDAEKARDDRMYALLSDIKSGTISANEARAVCRCTATPAAFPRATDYVAAANTSFRESTSTTPEKHRVGAFNIDGRIWRREDFTYEHRLNDSNPDRCTVEVKHVPSGIHADTDIRDIAHALRDWISGFPITLMQHDVVASFISNRIARQYPDVTPAVAATQPPTCGHRNPVDPAGRTGVGYTCTKAPGHTDMHAWVGQEYRPNAVWYNDNAPTELADLRAVNALLTNENRDLLTDNDRAIRLYEQSKHAITQLASARELLATVARQRAELQGQLAAARAELAEHALLQHTKTQQLINARTDLELVIAKGRRRKAAIRALERSNAYQGERMKWRDQALDRRLRTILNLYTRLDALKREVADRDRIIDDYHDAATGTTSRLCPDRNPQTGAPCLRAAGHEPFNHRSVARETAAAMWEYWATVPATPPPRCPAALHRLGSEKWNCVKPVGHTGPHHDGDRDWTDPDPLSQTFTITASPLDGPRNPL